MIAGAVPGKNVGANANRAQKLHNMPRENDLPTIRRLLNTDRFWSVYPLGDLAPEHFPHATWLRPAGNTRALALLYEGFRPPVLFALGEAEHLAALFDEFDEPELSLSVPPQVLPLLQPRYQLADLTAMWRMVLDADRFPRFDPACQRLTVADVPALERLYADGEASGERPNCFFPSMVERGVFCGIADNGELLAAAGTHLVVPAEGIAAIGNIYTRRDCRRRGLGARTTAAVVAELLQRQIETIALNVAQENGPAARVYERLGFRRYCAFFEGRALRR
jgi:ribosomal protein S18 acetylase RimI-like enzyme